MPTAGYSGTPLLKKLGVKQGQKALLYSVPDRVTELASFEEFASLKAPKTWCGVSGADYDYVHVFEKEAARLEKGMPVLRQIIAQDGMIWVSWPKKASKVETTITEDVVRNLALANGLVDIKVCAVDEIWSGLKLMIPKKDRI